MKKIWKRPATIELINKLGANTLGDFLKIQFTEIGNDYMKAQIMFGPNLQQPMGILHGGINAVLAESIGSVASYYTLEENDYSVGQNISTQHLRPVSKGFITGLGKPIHLGQTTQLWNIDTFNDEGKMTSTSRLSMMILKKINP